MVLLPSPRLCTEDNGDGDNAVARRVIRHSNRIFRRVVYVVRPFRMCVCVAVPRPNALALLPNINSPLSIYLYTHTHTYLYTHTLSPRTPPPSSSSSSPSTIEPISVYLRAPSVYIPTHTQLSQPVYSSLLRLSLRFSLLSFSNGDVNKPLAHARPCVGDLWPAAARASSLSLFPSVVECSSRALAHLLRSSFCFLPFSLFARSLLYTLREQKREESTISGLSEPLRECKNWEKPAADLCRLMPAPRDALMPPAGYFFFCSADSGEKRDETMIIMMMMMMIRERERELRRCGN